MNRISLLTVLVCSSTALLLAACSNPSPMGGSQTSSGLVATAHAAEGHSGGMMKTPKVGLHAYTKGHAMVSNPPDLLGGPLKVSIKKNNTSTRFNLPGPRFLDPAVFGTPAHPTGFDPAPFPLMGIPIDMRKSMGGKYTFVNHATPFSDWMEVGVGNVKMNLVDATAIDGARTKDKVDFEAEFESPDGKYKYRVVCKKALPHGFGFPFFGGVVTNHLLHGETGIGTRLMPTEYTYAAFWGVGQIYRNGKLINDKHLIHVMLTEFVRADQQKLQFDGGVDPQGMTLHLMVPPYRPTPQGPVKTPVKSGFIPFPFVKKHMQATMMKVKGMPDSPQKKAKMATMMEVKGLMMHTKEHVMKAMKAGKMDGQPFFHVMFGLRSSEVHVSH